MLTLTVQSCLLGYKLLSNGKCQQCAKGTYLFYTQTEPLSCKDCQSQFSECPGGSLVYPLPGYWRSSNPSEKFYQCIFQKACLGRNNMTDSFTGVCAEGYQGILCSDCALNFSKNPSLSRCSKCPKQNINILILTCLFTAFIVLIVILVNSNRVNSKNEKNYLPVFFRILVNHLQILYLTASFELEWPEELLNFYKSIQPISDAQSQIFSIDCFLTQGALSNYFNNYRPIVIKSILVMIFPIAIIILSMGSQIIWTKYFQKKTNHRIIQAVGDDEESIIEHQMDQQEKKYDIDSQQTAIQSSREDENINFISTLIVILFLIHPTITRQMFALFKQDFDVIFQLYVVVKKLMVFQGYILILRQFAMRITIFSYCSGLHFLP
ncbi:hypothetical protein FGO68_gene7468 [Halteria grandinella]|uniref:Transmembrane protein n=1 Tax=Halteria grandinella TaxID=5974 RepID=A0A8J8P6D2_HALGN|nr:hypothetical protein FGO68_gene7468 [Halteria grandinella]